MPSRGIQGLRRIGQVLDLGRGVRRERQRAFEPVLADIAPRADHVGNDADMHARGLIRYGHGAVLAGLDFGLAYIGRERPRRQPVSSDLDLPLVPAKAGIQNQLVPRFRGDDRSIELILPGPVRVDARKNHAGFGGSSTMRAISESVVSRGFNVASVTAGSVPALPSVASMTFFSTLAIRRVTTCAACRSVSVNTVKIDLSASWQAKSTWRIRRRTRRAASRLVRRSEAGSEGRSRARHRACRHCRRRG